MSQPVAFHDLPSSHFPFELRLYDKSGETLWRARVESPGALQVPAFPGRVGGCVITFANGEVLDAPATADGG